MNAELAVTRVLLLWAQCTWRFPAKTASLWAGHYTFYTVSVNSPHTFYTFYILTPANHNVFTLSMIIYRQYPFTLFSFIHQAQCNRECVSINKHATPTHTHTSLIAWSFSLLPRESLTCVRASVHPVLPTFIRPLTLSRHVHSAPRMWKPILACHLLTVIHIINRKSSCWLPKALNTSGELLSARQTFFPNEAKTFGMSAYLDGCRQLLWGF